MVLLVAGGSGALASSCVVAAQEMEQGGGTETRRAIRLAMFVNEEWKGDAGFLAKELRVAPVAEPDGGE